MALLKLQNFIGDSYVPPVHDKYIESMCPSTGKPHCLVPDSSAEDIAAAVVAAKVSWPQLRIRGAYICNRLRSLVGRLRRLWSGPAYY
jgi:acyl-CoA reductase-like NAD-dependent aldehyde dehydrogenase